MFISQITVMICNRKKTKQNRTSVVKLPLASHEQAELKKQITGNQISFKRNMPISYGRLHLTRKKGQLRALTTVNADSFGGQVVKFTLYAMMGLS